MGSLIQFEKEWFEAEDIGGFKISTMMKRYWAAELEVLVRIDALCLELGVQYFANWGTLLGAVRHGSFIPWDDDIDITMFRKDYEIFAAAAREGRLWDGLIIKEDHLDADYENLISRVVNSLELSTDDERMETYHGCPYILGVDIDVLDDMAPNDELDKEQREQMSVALKALEVFRNIENGKEDASKIDETISRVKNVTGTALEKTRSLKMQMHELIHEICKKYDDSNSTYATYPCLRLISREYNQIYEKARFEDLIRIPFGPITVPVPRHYHEYLRSSYGDTYMTPIICRNMHDYPLYKDQEEILKQELIKRKMSGKMFDIDTGY